jgi:hypothetical protein
MISLQRLWCLFMRTDLNLILFPYSFSSLLFSFYFNYRTNIFIMSTFFYYDIFMINGKSFAARAIREVYYAYFFQSAQ